MYYNTAIILNLSSGKEIDKQINATEENPEKICVNMQIDYIIKAPNQIAGERMDSSIDALSNKLLSWKNKNKSKFRFLFYISHK